MKLLVRIFIAFSSLCVVTLHASNITVPTYSFEVAPITVEDNGFIGNWSTTVTTTDTTLLEEASFVAVEVDARATEGTRFVHFSFAVGIQNTASMVNLLNYSLSANQTYNLGFDILLEPTLVEAINDIAIEVLDSQGGTLGAFDQSDLVLLNSAPAGSFARYNIIFNTGTIFTAGNISISARATGLASESSGLFLDNFGLTAVPVPEPASFALIGGALAACLVISRRKR
jgi:hypothetical protein